jgi:hypothetical protein
MGESPEDLLPADPVLGEVDRLRWLAVGLRWGDLAEGAVRPGGVVVPQVLGQHPVQVLLIDDQELCVPKASSTLCNQAVFVDQATNSSLFLDAVVVEIDRFG